MELTCVIALDYQGNPKIKPTKDCTQITLDVYTRDVNYLMNLEGKELVLSEK